MDEKSQQLSKFSLANAFTKKKKPSVYLPPELLEEIFLDLIFGDWTSRKTFSSLLYVNKQWSAVASRLQLVCISIRTEQQVNALMSHMDDIESRGMRHLYAPTRYLNIDTMWNQVPPKLPELLSYFGHSLETLLIRGNRITYVLPSPEDQFKARPDLSDCNSSSCISETTVVHLPRLRHLELRSIHVFDVLRLLHASRNTLTSLTVHHSGIVLVPELAARAPELSLPALRRLHVVEIEDGVDSTRTLLCNAAGTSLESLQFSINKKQLPATIDWLRESVPPSLKHISLWIKVGQYDYLDRKDESIANLWGLLDERHLSRNLVSFIGSGSW